jgi:hypothetical protein
MSSYAFSAHERYAVFTVHGEKCYLCGTPLDLLTMQVDHVIPESLLDRPERLSQVLAALGRPAGFSLNSYENWMPACGPCNRRKLDTAFDPSPIVQIVLQRAAARSTAAREAEAKTVTSAQLSRAVNLIQRMAREGPLDTSTLAILRPLVVDGDVLRTEANRGTPVRILPMFSVLSDDGNIKIVKGPYGVGGGPSNPSPQMRCPSCGNAAFNGARCVMCGAMDDD